MQPDRPRGAVLPTAHLHAILSRGEPPPPPPPEGFGPGTELRKLLASAPFRWLGIKEVEGCDCKAIALWMDELGPDGCLSRLGEILDRLEKNHAKMIEGKTKAGDHSPTVPFSRTGAELVVRKAIRQGRKALAKRAAAGSNDSI